jgi:hypothetical protein
MRGQQDIREIIQTLGLERAAAETVPEAQVAELEKQWGVFLPAHYRSFLRAHCPAYVRAGLVYRPVEPNPWTCDNGLNEFDLFLGLTDSMEHRYDIRHAAARSIDRLSRVVVPIAEAPGGNLLCLGLRGTHRDNVYFWDHEQRGSKDLYIVASTFLGFVLSFEESPPTLDDDGPVGMWLADDL